VEITSTYDEEAQALDLTVTQATPPTPGQPVKRPLPIPLALGLLDGEGAPQSFRTPGGNALVHDAVLVLDQAEQRFRLENVNGRRCCRRCAGSPLR
jgi:aminopeptidase N